MKSKKKRPYLGFLKEYAFKKKLLPYYILTIAIIVLTAGVSLVRPELQGKVIDDLGNPHGTSLSAFMLLLAVFLGMLLLNYLMNYVQRYVVAVISEEIAADMRQKVEDKLSTVSVNFFEKIKLSDILLKVDKDVSAVKQCGITSIITLISNIVILVSIRELPYLILSYLSSFLLSAEF
jgi:ABC-type multidrug transport system fused ATPase/permease subunit